MRSRAWSWRHGVAESDLAATTKHVLLTLSLHMTDAGERCWPPIAQLAAECSLSRKAVMEHLALAEAAGWIGRGAAGMKGQRWKRQEYAPLWPGNSREGGHPALPPSTSPGIGEGEQEVATAAPEGGHPELPPSRSKVVTVVPEGGHPGDPKAVTLGDRDKNIPRLSHGVSQRARAREPTTRDFDLTEEVRRRVLAEFEVDAIDHQWAQFRRHAKAHGKRYDDIGEAFLWFLGLARQGVRPRRAEPPGEDDAAAKTGAPMRVAPGIGEAATMAFAHLRGALRDSVPRHEFKSWLAPLALMADDATSGAGFTLGAPTKFMRDWVERNYAALIARLAGRAVTIVVGTVEAQGKGERAA